MAPKKDSTKIKTPKNPIPQATHCLRDENTDESSYTVDEYPLEEQVKSTKQLPQGDKATLGDKIPPHSKPKIKNPRTSPPYSPSQSE